MNAYTLDPSAIKDISNLLLDAEEKLRVVPASALALTTPKERLLFGTRRGLYSFPTDELVAFLRKRIGGRSAIEIGSGHGALAAALEIPATDNRQQEDQVLRDYYRAIGQPPVPYGSHVERLDASDAVRKYRPQVVIACWVTHRFDPARPEAAGSATGVREEQIIQSCDEYVFIGNEEVHASKPIWSFPHQKFTPSWLYSRALNGSPEFIASWRRADLG